MNFVFGKNLNMNLLMQKAADWFRMNHSKDVQKPKPKHVQNQAFNVGLAPFHISKPQREPSREIRCFYCKKLGHKVSEYPKKKQSVSFTQLKSDSSFFLAESHATSDLDCESNFILADSGATRHMSPCFESFDDDFEFFESGTESFVKLGDEHRLRAVGFGSFKFLKKNPDGSEKVCFLRDCLFVPDLCSTLMSIPQVAKRGFKTLFDGICHCTICDIARGGLHKPQCFQILQVHALSAILRLHPQKQSCVHCGMPFYLVVRGIFVVRVRK